jgi:hypothetical protein
MNAYFEDAEAVVRLLSGYLARKRLNPAFRWVKYTESPENDAWMLAMLDLGRVQNLAAYRSQELMTDLRAVAKGRPVYWLEDGAYAVLLSPVRKLPKMVVFPGTKRGVVRIGMRKRGELALSWASLGHVMVAGMTGVGKSVFLRSLAYQMVQDGGQIMAADIDKVTLPMFEAHPALFAPIAETEVAAGALLERALGECEHRSNLFKGMEGYPETLEEYNKAAIRLGEATLAPILVMLDEFSATVEALGGARGNFASNAAQLGWRGRKFGLRVVYAAQDFSKETVGKIRDQVKTVVAFKVRSQETARAVGVEKAYHLPADHPGMASTNLYGYVQAYYLDKALITNESGLALPNLLSEAEEELFARAWSGDRKLSRARLIEWGGMSEWTARSTLAEWANRGWVEKDGGQTNSFCVTQKIGDLLSKSPTAPTGSNWSPSTPSGSPTGSKWSPSLSKWSPSTPSGSPSEFSGREE